MREVKFSTDKAKWFEDGEGFWVCLRTQDRQVAAELAAAVDGKPWDAAVTPQRTRRSLDANAYFWVLLDKLAVALRTGKSELYQAYVRDIGGNSERVCVHDNAVAKLRSGWEHNGMGWVTDTMPSKIANCTVVILYYGSSTYDTKQMARLIDLVSADCKDNAIETMTPLELERIKEEWGRA